MGLAVNRLAGQDELSAADPEIYRQGRLNDIDLLAARGGDAQVPQSAGGARKGMMFHREAATYLDINPLQTPTNPRYRADRGNDLDLAIFEGDVPVDT